MERDERALVEAAQADPARFAELYQEHFDRIYAYVVSRVRDRDAAEDLTSEVFRHALGAIRTFEWRGVPFSSWLYRIAANEIADHAKKKAREATIEVEPAASEMNSIEERASLFRLVDALPADQRRVVVMRFAEEKSIREIAEAVGRSEGAVKQLQFRALQTLRARMGRNHG